MKSYLRLALVAMLLAGGVLSLAFAQAPAVGESVPVRPSVGAATPAADNLPPTGAAPVAAPAASAPGFAPEPPPPGYGVPSATARAVNEGRGQTVYVVGPDGKVISRAVGSMSPYRAGFGETLAGDPDAAKLYAAEEEAAKEAQAIVNQLRSVDDEKVKGEVSLKLREALGKQFDAQQKRRALEVSKIEERLKKLKDTMKKREDAKETIVGRRLDELTGVTDELGWEETRGTPARLYQHTTQGLLLETVPVLPPGPAPAVPATPRNR